jgi:hypothetical protein
MKDPNMSTSDAIRFTVTGLVLTGLLYVVSPDIVNSLIEKGAVVLAMFAFAAGTILYFIYRSLLYEPFLTRLQDCCRRARNPNYRMRFRATFGCRTNRAELFRLYIRSRRALPELSKYASGAHMLYLSSFLFFAFAVWSCIDGDTKTPCIIPLFLGGCILFASAFLQDRHTENLETRILRTIPDDELAGLWNQFNR